MSKYTTGEIAKLCGVSVRTVQYYDDRAPVQNWYLWMYVPTL